jgi:hypothetical protein
MYGLVNRHHLSDAVKEVCECLGYGSSSNADKLLIETSGAETHKGQAKDNSIGAGMGITQFDKMPFYDVKDRCRNSDKNKIKEYFNIDIDLVEWEHIRYNPLLCLIFTRLKYLKVSESIPTDLKGRARYWKQYYNTEAGKGTIEHYIESNS